MHGRHRAAAAHGTGGVQCDLVLLAFAVAALVIFVLNFGIVLLSPLLKWHGCSLSDQLYQEGPRRLSQLAEGPVLEAWSCLHNLDRSSLRLLPDKDLEQRARQGPRWLFIGVSSVQRKAEYLGLTLSHLFDAMGTAVDTGIVVHLADFDENWVSKSQEWLRSGFDDEVQANRLHVIHAPERLYPPREEVQKSTKFGDPPHRQWWRAKQNLDYAFLMWYAAGLAEYYMQLEDDVQVVPSFLPTVRRYMREKAAGNEWVMIAFSKLGFIGKTFRSSRLPKLAEFLLVFHDQAPCDWLVWIFIDAASSQPVTGQIAKDLEDEFVKRAQAKHQGKTGKVENPKSMRNDVLLFYRERNAEQVFLSPAAAASPKPTVPAVPSLLPLPIEQVPSVRQQMAPGTLPPAQVYSNMKHWKQYAPEAAYGSSLKGFWTSDTCDASRAATPCMGPEKFIEVVFSTDVDLKRVRLVQAASDHPQDFLRNGTLEVGKWLRARGAADQPHCESYQVIAPVTQREAIWSGVLSQPVRCLRVRMLAAQKEWIMLKFAEVVSEVGPRPATTQAAMQAVPPRKEVEVPTVPAARADPTLLEETEDPTTTATMDRPETEGPEKPEGSEGLEAMVWNPGSSGTGQPESSSSTYQPPLPLARLNAIVRSVEAHVEEPDQDTLAGMLAFSVGLLAGIVGWANVFLCQTLSLPGVHLVGRLPCWMASFVPAIDSMLYLSMDAPNVDCKFQERKLARQHDKMQAGGWPWWSSVPVELHQAEQAPARRLGAGARSWEEVQSPARRVDSSSFQVVGPTSPPRRWLAIGMTLRCSEQQAAMDKAVEVLRKLLAAGDDSLVVLVHLSDELAEHRSRLARLLETELASDVEAGRFLAVRAPEPYYQDASRKTDNYELAVLLVSAAPLADYYMQVEADVLLKQGFIKTLQSYITAKQQENEPWHMISLSQDGHRRKIWRSASLATFAELLAIFPDVPPDSLLWDFIDTINNQSAPKACAIASSATKFKRADVLLQYHKAEALIEHVGDVSSLEGKVQRIHDDYFKKHNLISSLFDNPVADIYTADMVSASSQLQAVYGSSGIASGQGYTKVGTLTAPYLGDMVGDGQAVLEVVFKEPTAVQMVNLRMGGHLRTKTKKQKTEEADPDFDFVLDHARIEFGRGRHQSAGSSAVRGAHVTFRKGRCTDYEPVVNISGREVFWRCPLSRPVMAVECVKVTLLQPQQKAAIIRSIRIRSAKPRRLSEEHHDENDAELEQVESMSVDLAKWQEKMVTWSLIVSAAFFAGSLVFFVGCVATTLHVPGPRRREPKRRTKVSQA
ncbi:MGAT4C [Symbiodinium natans]|uniref:MGAT4C protein n=1 Tax=Symbiodinium natans TaxID=878477 RepID=A0A812IBF2_9DINO|nr:MGAT4C [Symbiodinium natans]